MDTTTAYTVQVCEFSTSRSFDVQLTAQSTVAELKKKISEQHERRPDQSTQKVSH